MSNTKPTSAAAEKMAKDLKSTLADRRPRPWKTIVFTLLICTLALAGMSWWFYPRPRLEPLQIVAIDELCTPDETLSVRAQLYDVIERESPRRMHGHTMVFLEPPPLLQPVGKTLEVIKQSDDQGRAFTAWPTPKALYAEFRAEHIDLAEKAKTLDHARIFVYAKDAPLFLVDVDETLKTDKLDDAAADSLMRAAKEGWQIVYLAVGSEKPMAYHKTRDWVVSQANLPRGPVLARSAFTEQSARRELLKSVKNRFTGNVVAIVKSVDAAVAARDAGLRVYQLSADPIAGVVGVASWADVPVRLR